MRRIDNRGKRSTSARKQRRCVDTDEQTRTLSSSLRDVRIRLGDYCLPTAPLVP